jgi:hypothetical protein
MQPATCLNCTGALAPGDSFCARCGQSARLHRLNLAHLGHEVLHFFTHADKGIFFLLKELITKTGAVARAYVEGQRKKYFSPLNFYFIAIGLFVFVQTSFRPVDAVDLSAVKQQVMQVPDPVKRDRMLLKLERREKGITFMTKYANVINFILAPLIALLFYLFYFRSRFNYTEHLVATLYITGMNALFFVLITPVLVLSRGSWVYFAGLIAFFVFESVYRGIFYYRFINKRGIAYLAYPMAISILQTAGYYFLSTGLFNRYINQGHLL